MSMMISNIKVKKLEHLFLDPSITHWLSSEPIEYWLVDIVDHDLSRFAAHAEHGTGVGDIPFNTDAGNSMFHVERHVIDKLHLFTHLLYFVYFDFFIDKR